MQEAHLKTAQNMAAQVTKALGGAGIWGVEFFIADDGVYFSELSPRPHDTGMVTLGNTQNFNELATASNTDFRLFGKPSSRPYRRMGVVVTYDSLDGDVKAVTERAKSLANEVTVH